MLAQAVAFNFGIGENSCPTKYFPEASSINPRRSATYGLGVLQTAVQFRLHRWGLRRYRLFEAERMPRDSLCRRECRPRGSLMQMATDTVYSPPRVQRFGLAAMNTTAITVAALMLLVLVLRVMMVRGSGIWRDEAQLLWIVRFPSLGAIIEFLRLHEWNPPLFYMMMRTWLAALGDTEAAALMLPIGLGVALVPAVYLVGRRTLGQRTGLMAAALVAMSPMLALHSGLVRPYSLLPLLCLASVYTLWRGLCGGRAWAWMTHAPATLAMVLTHNWGWLVLGAGVGGRRGLAGLASRRPGNEASPWLDTHPDDHPGGV